VYSVLRFEDLFQRGAYRLLALRSYETNLLLLELILGLVIPIVLLLIPKVRQSAGGLYLASVLVVLGFVTNRLNVTITGMEGSAGVRYFPKWTEIAITGSIIGVAFAIFALAVKYLPIFSPAEPRPAQPEPEAAELLHARS